MIVPEVFGFVNGDCPERSGGAWAGIWGAGERGGQPLYPLLTSVEARLILDSQGLILHPMLSDEVASVRQIGRTNSAKLRERLISTVITSCIALWLMRA